MKNKFISLDDLPYYYKLLKGKSVSQVIKLCYDKFGKRLGMTTALGYSGMILMHHLYKLEIDIDIYFIDTGYHFKETLELLDKIRDQWGLNLISVKIDNKLKKYVRENLGSRPWEDNPNLCCHYHKIGPLLEILPEKTAWLSSIRRDQSSTRAEIDIVELDGRGTFKVYPLYNWTRKKAWNYLIRNKLFYNTLHDKRYFSIGCKPCTSSVENASDERSGRWKSTPKLECGLHFEKTIKLKTKGFTNAN